MEILEELCMKMSTSCHTLKFMRRALIKVISAGWKRNSRKKFNPFQIAQDLSSPFSVFLAGIQFLHFSFFFKVSCGRIVFLAVFAHEKDIKITQANFSFLNSSINKAYFHTIKIARIKHNYLNLTLSSNFISIFL